MNGKLVYGIGINDIKGSYKEKYKSIWKQMLQRCYSEKYLIRYPTYKNIYVCDEWHTLSKFRDWFLSANYKDGYVLDKDLFIPDNIVYNSEICLFIPQNINKLIIKQKGKGYSKTNGGKYIVYISINGKNINLGTYKTEKEAHQVYIEYKANRYVDIADTFWKTNDKIATGLYRHAETLLEYDWKETLPE